MGERLVRLILAIRNQSCMAKTYAAYTRVVLPKGERQKIGRLPDLIVKCICGAYVLFL